MQFAALALLATEGKYAMQIRRRIGPTMSRQAGADRDTSPFGGASQDEGTAALRCRICGSIRIVASSHERARRMLEALPAGGYRLVTVPAAEARIAACKHNNNNVNTTTKETA